jgi:hypothetical protein
MVTTRSRRSDPAQLGRYCHDDRDRHQRHLCPAHRLRLRNGQPPALLWHHRAAAGRRAGRIGPATGLGLRTLVQSHRRDPQFQRPDPAAGRQRYHPGDPAGARRKRSAQAQRSRPHCRGGGGRPDEHRARPHRVAAAGSRAKPALAGNAGVRLRAGVGGGRGAVAIAMAGHRHRRADRLADRPAGTAEQWPAKDEGSQRCDRRVRCRFGGDPGCQLHRSAESQHRHHRVADRAAAGYDVDQCGQRAVSIWYRAPRVSPVQWRPS